MSVILYFHLLLVIIQVISKQSRVTLKGVPDGINVKLAQTQLRFSSMENMILNIKRRTAAYLLLIID